jgi:hypothetical protein
MPYWLYGIGAFMGIERIKTLKVLMEIGASAQDGCRSEDVRLRASGERVRHDSQSAGHNLSIGARQDPHP